MLVGVPLALFRSFLAGGARLLTRTSRRKSYAGRTEGRRIQIWSLRWNAGGRVRATLPGERQAPEEVAVAVHRRRGGRGGVARRSLCVASMERIDVTLRERLDRRLRPTFLNGLVAGSGWGSANPCSSALCLRRAWSSSEFIRETVPSRKFVRVSPVRISPTSGQVVTQFQLISSGLDRRAESSMPSQPVRLQRVTYEDR